MPQLITDPSMKTSDYLPLHGLGLITGDMRRCAEVCQDSAAACMELIPYCLRQGGKMARPDHVRLLLDCAEICSTSASFLSRDSDKHAWICGVCADICEECAWDCESFHDSMMGHCAEICRQCARSCRRMAAS